MVIEEAESRLRSLFSQAEVDPLAGPASALPVLRRFCAEPAETDSDMILWETGNLADWIEDTNGDWHQGPPRWMFSICRQLERGEEIGASDDEPAGFFQIQCAWYFVPERDEEFAEWSGDDESVDHFFDRVAASPSFAYASTHTPVATEVTATWV